MFQTLHHWFDRQCNPIGVDFGSDCLRVAQVELHGSDASLIAAASVDVPAPVRDDPTERLLFLRDALPELIGTESFRGRRIVLALSAASAFIQHLVLPLLSESELNDAMQKAARRLVPADAASLLIRQQAVQRIAEDECEIIMVGAPRAPIVQMLTAAQDAGIDVVAMNTELGALCDFYLHVYRRHTDRSMTTAIVDLGYNGTRFLVVRDRQIVAAHGGLVGGQSLTQAVAHALQTDLESARMLRLKRSRTNTTSVSDREQHVVFVAPTCDAPLILQREHAAVESALQGVTESLCRSLASAKATFETSRNGSPIERLLFVGGESRDRRLCECIARHLGVTACVGDPLLRMGRASNVCVSSGIDRRQPQPAWAVAIGLSLGPAGTMLPSVDDELAKSARQDRI